MLLVPGRPSGPPYLHSVYDAALTAEIYWLAKLASCNFSLRSADHIGDTFKKMFPDSKSQQPSAW